MESSRWQYETILGIRDQFPAFGFVAKIADILASLNQKREIYMLTSFIEAHEEAQKKISSFMGYIDDEDTSRESEFRKSLTYGESNVIEESQTLVIIKRLY